MLSKEIRQVLEENMKYTRMLEEYDKTRELGLDKIRRSFTLKKGSYRKLKTMSKSTGKPMSAILDQLIELEAESG